MENLSVVRTIDEKCRIDFPLEFMTTTGWSKFDKLLMTYNEQDETVTLKLSGKYPGPKCVFCKKVRTKMLLHGISICENCLQKAEKL